MCHERAGRIDRRADPGILTAGCDMVCIARQLDENARGRGRDADLSGMRWRRADGHWRHVRNRSVRLLARGAE